MDYDILLIPGAVSLPVLTAACISCIKGYQSLQLYLLLL